MSVLKIKNRLKSIISSSDKSNFIYDFIIAFDQSVLTIQRLKKNKSQNQTVLILRNKIYFYKLSKSENSKDVIDKISKSAIIRKFSIRYIIVTDFIEFLSIDTISNERLNINFDELFKHVDFFLNLKS